MISNVDGTIPFPPVSPDHGSDVGGDDDAGSLSLSQYSSCGESEFERYCSANSVMGTPSFRSSSIAGAFNDDSLDGIFDNFSLGGQVDRGLVEEQKRRLSNLGNDGFKESVPIVDCPGESSGVRDGLDDGGPTGSVGSASGEKDCWGTKLDSDVGCGVDGREEDDMVPYRYEHSDDDEDDSMYGCDSDGEDRKGLYMSSKEVKIEKGSENECPLLMNSSVAFGSGDWDDFELETGAGNFGSMTWNKFQKEEKSDTERNFCGSAPVSFRQVEDDMEENFNSRSETLPTSCRDSKVEQMEEVRGIPVASCEVQASHGWGTDESITITPLDISRLSKLEQEDITDTSGSCCEVHHGICITENSDNSFVSDVFEMEKDPVLEKPLARSGLMTLDNGQEGHLSQISEESIHTDDGTEVVNHKTGVFEVTADPLSVTVSQRCSHPTERSDDTLAVLFDDQNSTKSLLRNNLTSDNASDSRDVFEDHAEVIKAETFEPKEFYNEIVNEMEEILLDTGESPGARFPQGNRMFQWQPSLPLRDGGSTASTSGTDDGFTSIEQPLRIDGVEVVGAKQKKGDVSLSERLVGVKEYTVYVIRVWSGKDHWEIERRYREFFTLYRRLKSYFSDQGWILPSPWSCVEKESRKIFGNASPDVVSERSALIQECLSSIIHSEFYSSLPSSLIWFLVPQDSFPSSTASRTPVLWSIFSGGGADAEKISTLGKTISLIVEIRPYKSTKQMLEAQHYTCAGCHKHFDDGMTLMRDFVQTLGWGKPRLCEYTGQLFCSSCHTNETAVLPARVLHHWDFTQYPVSQLAKSYLDSIYDQPMLCVSAVNPLLFSKVPALHHVMCVRKKIGTMLPYIRCPFRRSINRCLRSRRYLLESNDFFALRDLIDLSKGAFAALPVIVETLSRKILEHIAEQCLICCDVGVPCSARQTCNDPSSLIFPFQEVEIERCPSCGSVFHKACFRKVTNCSCGEHLGVEEVIGHSNMFGHIASSALLGSKSSSALSMGFLSGLFSKARAETITNQKDSDTVILMGSLPTNSL